MADGQIQTQRDEPQTLTNFITGGQQSLIVATEHTCITTNQKQFKKYFVFLKKMNDIPNITDLLFFKSSSSC